MDESVNPFLRYRRRLDSHARALAGGMIDDEFVDLVGRLDAAVTTIDGTGFVITPVIDGASLAAAADLDVELWIKSEAGNVAGSHKARHLFGVALHMLVDEAFGTVPAIKAFDMLVCSTYSMVITPWLS